MHEQLPNIPMDNIIAEPERRNISPCIAYADWKIKYHRPNRLCNVEHYSEIYTIPSDFGWSYLGNRESLYQLLEHDVTNTSKVGNAELLECSNYIVYVTDMEKVVLQGLDGYIVSVKNEKSLVCKRSAEQKIKKFNIE